MKKILCLSAWLLLASPAAVWAQADDVAEPAAPASTVVQQQDGAMQTVEAQPGKPTTYIRTTDSGGTIEEVREGADTKSITVKPANNAPNYHIMPEARSGQPGNYGNQGGKRVWKVLSF